MRKISILLTAVFVCAFVQRAKAMDPTEAKEKAKLYAEKNIEQCFKEAYKNNPIGTQGIGKAIFTNRECLENKVRDEAKKIFDDEDYIRITKHIEQISSGYRMYYSDIYNRNKACRPSCGTMFNHVGSSYYVMLLEQILEDTAFIKYLNDI
ncbi:MAG: hypothetical protein GY804_01855 [Alphaproteobacteria bacterium]|nr:hypothetical protein [Alphaproteobacteria bacterium]